MKKFAAIFAAVLLIVSVFMVSASAKLFTDDTVYTSTGTLGSFPSSYSSAISIYKIEVVRDGNVIFSYGFDGDVSVFRNSSSGNTILRPVFYAIQGSDTVSISCPYSLFGTDTVYVYSSSALSWGTPSSDTVPAAISSLSGGIFDVGDSLLTFIQSSWLTLVALGAFLVVLCVGVIRRLVKGV